MLVPRDIALVEERRHATLMAGVVAETLALGGGWACFDRPESWTNYAVGLAMDHHVSHDELNAFVAFYTARDTHPRIEVCPYADASLIRGLASRGFITLLFEAVLALDLSQALAFERHHDALTMEVVDPDNDAMLRVFVDSATSGFRPQGARLDKDSWSIASRLARLPRACSILACWDGEPVGGASLDVSDPVAHLFGASVRPAWRGRGIHRALMAERFAIARDYGCTLATVQGITGGPTEHNAQRLGCSLAYHKALMGLEAPQF